MFELLPGAGVVLPAEVGTLGLGADVRTAVEVLAGLGPVRPLPGAPWIHTSRWGDVEVAVHADPADRAAAVPGEPLVRSVVLSRGGAASGVPGGTPVVLGDVDLFGYPAAEVVEALGDHRPPGLELRAGDGRGYITGVALHATPPTAPTGRRARTAAEAAEAERALAGHEPLWTTERDQWQLLEAGGGHLPCRRDDPQSILLICNEAVARRVVAAMLAAGVEVVPEQP
ncbi:hypothetical protein [Kitasatospora cheerisanensis]|uniref:Uncharacterized protein n=1 Tax=Kitasatospora cheerisanensis KCTC 2395 TaxID=1348663 RepID=A0A066Z407_9ACTN|nr:hypothetical protein [Kitasatospora cheerisanensis]KDN88197.1 hypothetical protein KCH_00470 [Kitasatospora cheerisanensis KCTC 2395]